MDKIEEAHPAPRNAFSVGQYGPYPTIFTPSNAHANT